MGFGQMLIPKAVVFLETKLNTYNVTIVVDVTYLSKDIGHDCIWNLLIWNIFFYEIPVLSWLALLPTQTPCVAQEYPWFLGPIAQRTDEISTQSRKIE